MKCREPLEVPNEHFVRQLRYPTLRWDRKLCAPALLPVCPERTIVQARNCTGQTSFPLKQGKYP